jgi:hypothetical protein
VISGGRDAKSPPWVVLVSRRHAAAEEGVAAPEITVEPGHGVISHATWISLAAACCSGLVLYSIKHRTTVMDAEIGRTFRATKAAHDSTAILKVEWAALNEPTRLQTMASQYLTLKATIPSQFVALTDLPGKLPAPGTIIPGPMPPVTPLNPAPPPADPAPVQDSAPAVPELVASAAPPAAAPAQQAAAEPASTPPSVRAATAAATAPAIPAPAATPTPDTSHIQLADATPAIAAVPASPPVPEPMPPVSAATAPPVAGPPPVEVAPPASAKLAEASLPTPSVAPPPPRAVAPDMQVASTDADADTSLPAPRPARPAPRAANRPVMLARMRPPAIIAPPQPRNMALAAIAPPRIRLPVPAAAHARPDVPHGRVAPAPMLHLAMARQPPRHDVTLAEFMAQIDTAKATPRHTVAPHHVGQARSEPAHNLSLPSPPAEILVARSEPPHHVQVPETSTQSALGGAADLKVASQPRQEEAAVQPRYQPPAYRYPPYQMPYGSPYSPVYRSPWGSYAWASRPYYPQPVQQGYAYQ